jgi:hypothetical protein
MFSSMSTTDWLTLALVVITALYAWATYEILKANKKVVEAMDLQIEAQLRPYIVASVSTRPGTAVLLLEIQNTGKSPALNTRLTIDKDFYFNADTSSRNLAKLPIFTQPIESFAPSVKIPFMLGIGHTIFSNNIDDSICPKIFTITAEYTFAGKQYKERNTIDLQPLFYSSTEHDPIANEVKNLRESIEKLYKK